MKMCANVQVELDGYDLAHQLTHEQATKLILDLDLSMQDADFTENLLVQLMQSMRNEYSDEEYNNLMEKFK